MGVISYSCSTWTHTHATISHRPKHSNTRCHTLRSRLSQLRSLASFIHSKLYQGRVCSSSQCANCSCDDWGKYCSLHCFHHYGVGVDIGKALRVWFSTHGPTIKFSQILMIRPLAFVRPPSINNVVSQRLCTRFSFCCLRQSIRQEAGNGHQCSNPPSLRHSGVESRSDYA